MNRQMIVQAIGERRVLTLVYAGGAARTVQPHAILQKADGTELLEAFQVAGFSEGGQERGWKHFVLDRIDTAEALGEQFQPRRDFRPVDGESGRLVATVLASGEEPGE
ncbi:MAG: WYL domain-containing protein [Gemmatimonadaceae bacterium]